MARIPMKGDPPTLQQFVKKYGDPADHLAAAYFDSLARVGEHELADEASDAHSFRQMAEKCRKDLARYGLVPEILDGVPKAVRAK